MNINNPGSEKKSHNSEDGWQLSLLSKREKWGAGSMWVRGSSGKGFGKKVNDDWKAGNWHHIVVSFEGENVTIYSDGKNRGNGKIIPVNKMYLHLLSVIFFRIFSY